jgi:hypothetical protein
MRYSARPSEKNAASRRSSSATANASLLDHAANMGSLTPKSRAVLVKPRGYAIGKHLKLPL